MTTITIKQAQIELSRIDWVLRKVDSEFQVKPKGVKWDAACVCFADHIEDAVATAKAENVRRAYREAQHAAL